MIDSINCHSSGILRSVDHHLEPPVRKIPSYIKDANAGAFEGETPSSQAFEGQIIIIVNSSAIFGTRFLTSSFLFLRMSYRHCR